MESIIIILRREVDEKLNFLQFFLYFFFFFLQYLMIFSELELSGFSAVTLKNHVTKIGRK